MASNVFDVAVVGGGLSGMTAARDLKRSGITNFVVLEARDRVGGRTLNQYADGVIVDGGGTWFNTNQTAVHDLIHELGITPFSQYVQGDAFAVIGGKARRARPAAPDPHFAAIMNEMAFSVPLEAPWTAPKAAEWDAMTFEDFLNQSKLTASERMTVEIIFQIVACAPLKDVTFLNMLFCIHACGGYEGIGAVGSDVPQFHVIGGTAGMSNRIAEDLGPIVRLSSPVQSVSNWQEEQGPVRLQTPAGTIEAKRVILAMGASIAADIRFDPELPELRKGLHETIDKDHSEVKTHTTYERPFWRNMNASGQIISPDGVFNISADVTPPDTSKGVLVTLVHAPPHGASMSPEERKAKTIEVFAKCFGDEALKPTDWVMQDWNQETYTRGVEDIWSRGLYLKYGPALRTPIDRLIWAGTETSLFWCGYLDGAVRAGHLAALRALGALADE
jgi:monoamine oxidase